MAFLPAMDRSLHSLNTMFTSLLPALRSKVSYSETPLRACINRRNVVLGWSVVGSLRLEQNHSGGRNCTKVSSGKAFSLGNLEKLISESTSITPFPYPVSTASGTSTDWKGLLTAVSGYLEK